MPKYRKDSNRIVNKNVNLYIPHGGDDNEEASTVTRIQFDAGTNVGVIKQETRKVLRALGLTVQEAKRYIKEAFNNFEDIENA